MDGLVKKRGTHALRGDDKFIFLMSWGGGERGPGGYISLGYVWVYFFPTNSHQP